MSGIEVNRQRLFAMTNCHFIDPDDFLERATSRQSLLRADDPHARVHGLFDPSTGARFLVEDEKLSQWRNRLL